MMFDRSGFPVQGEGGDRQASGTGASQNGAYGGYPYHIYPYPGAPASRAAPASSTPAVERRDEVSQPASSTFSGQSQNPPSPPFSSSYPPPSPYPYPPFNYPYAPPPGFSQHNAPSPFTPPSSRSGTSSRAQSQDAPSQSSAPQEAPPMPQPGGGGGGGGPQPYPFASYPPPPFYWPYPPPYGFYPPPAQPPRPTSPRDGRSSGSRVLDITSGHDLPDVPSDGPAPKKRRAKRAAAPAVAEAVAGASALVAMPQSHTVVIAERRLAPLRKPQNSFMLFSNEYRSVLQAKYKNLSNQQISELLGNLWKSLPPEKQLPYQEQARKLKEEFDRSHPNLVFKRRKRGMRESDGPAIRPTVEIDEFDVQRLLPVKFKSSVAGADELAALKNDIQVRPLSVLEQVGGGLGTGGGGGPADEAALAAAQLQSYRSQASSASSAGVDLAAAGLAGFRR